MKYTIYIFHIILITAFPFNISIEYLDREYVEYFFLFLYSKEFIPYMVILGKYCDSKPFDIDTLEILHSG